jgi:hypothetical protein
MADVTTSSHDPGSGTEPIDGSTPKLPRKRPKVNTPVPTSACGGAGTNADNAVIWAPATTTSPMPVVLSNGSKGCCSDTLFVGSVFLPGQEVSLNSNQSMEAAGQVYSGNWQVQSGDHPNPAVSFDASDIASVAEILRLVE